MAFWYEEERKPKPPVKEDPSVWTDAYNLLSASSSKMVGDASRTGGYLTSGKGWTGAEKMFSANTRAADLREAQSRAKISPEMTEATSGLAGFAKSPGRAVVGHIAQSVPEMAGTVASGAIGSLAGPAGTAAGLFGAGYASSASRAIGEMATQVQSASNSDLVKYKPFAQKIASGMTYDKAREWLVDKMVKESSVNSAATIYGLANIFGGVEAAAVRSLVTAPVKRGVGAFAKEVGKTSIGEAGQEAVQTPVEDIVSQQANIARGAQKQFDPYQTARAAGEGAILGGITGGALGAPIHALNTRIERKPKLPPEVIPMDAQAAIEAAKKTSSLPDPAAQTVTVDTMATASQQAATAAQPTPTPPAAPVQPPVAPAPAAPTITPETAPAPAPAPARPVVTEEEFLNNADQPDPDVESEILTAPTEEPLPAREPLTLSPAPDQLISQAKPKKAKAKKTKLPPQPKGTEGVALTPEITPVVEEETKPAPAVETPAPIEEVVPVTPLEKTKKPQPKFADEAAAPPPEPKVLRRTDIEEEPSVVVAGKVEPASAAKAREAAAETAEKRAMAKGEYVEDRRPDNALRAAEIKWSRGETADPTGKRPGVVANLIAMREAAPGRAKVLIINRAIRRHLNAEIADVKAKAEREAEAEAKVKRDRTPTQKVAEIASTHDLIPARAFEKAPPKSRAMTILKQLRNIGKALDDAEVPANSSPFETGVRALLDRVRQGGQQVTVDDIQKLNEYQDKAVTEVETAPEEIGSETGARKAIKKAAKQAAETVTEEARTEEVTAEATEQTELTDEQRTSEYTDLKVGKESSRTGPVRGIGTEGAASEARKFTPDEIKAYAVKLGIKQDVARTSQLADDLTHERIYTRLTAKTFADDIAKFGPAGRTKTAGPAGEKIFDIKPDGVSTVKELLSGTSYIRAATDYLSDHPAPVNKFGTRIAVVKVMQRIANALIAKAPDVKVYLVDPAVMDTLAGPNTNGYYNPNTNAIYVRSDFAGTSKFQTLVLHEAIHAAYTHYIQSSPEAKKDLEALFNYVKKNHSEEFEGADTEYAMRDVEEFLTEALSNPQVMTILSQIELPASLNKQLGVDAAGKTSALKAFWGLIAKALGVQQTTVFEGILALQSRLEEGQYENYWTPQMRTAYASRKTKEAAGKIATRLNVAPPTKGPPKQGGSWWHSTDKSHTAWLKARQFDQLARDADPYYGGEENNPLRAVAEGPEKRHVIVSKYVDQGNEVVREAIERVREFGAQGIEFMRLAQDVTINNTHPDVPLTDPKNLHTGKESFMGAQSRARHPELMARWQVLPDELKALWHKISKFTTDRQNRMTLDVLENIIKVVLEKPDPALAKRIFEDTATDADWALFKTNTVLGSINNALELKKINGFYMPLTREGNYVVRGTYDLTKENLMGGTVLNDSVIQFVNPTPGKRGGKTKLEATVKAYLAQSELKPLGVHRIAVDPNDHTKQVPKEDPNGVLAFRVKMQTQHMEMKDTQKEAEAAREELLAMDNVKDVTGVEPAQQPVGGERPDMLATTFNQLANKIVSIRGEEALSGPLGAALREMSVRVLGSTRVQSRRMPRRYVKGYSDDAIHSLSTYNISSAGYLGKLETQPGIDKALSEAKAYLDAHNKEPSSKTLPRRRFYEEAESRIRNLNARIPAPIDRKVNTVLSLIQLDKLATASYHMINMLQNISVTMPFMAGRHGIRAVTAAMTDAYRLVGVPSTVWAGLRDTARAGKSEAGNAARYLGLTGKPGQQAELPVEVTDYVKNLRGKLAKAPNGKDLIRLMDELDILIRPDASFEVGMLTGSRNAAAMAIQRASFVVRQIGQAVETINRSTAAIAAYNLELKRNGGDSDAAVRYAKNVVQMTHFNYSQTNAPPIMSDRHPFARIALQFKKYAQNMVYLMVKLGHTAISKENSPEVRREAFKSLAYVLGTTASIAGVLGLPTEPFRVGVMLLGALGVIDDDWEDVERWVEENFGTVAAHGLPNLFGVDVSTRMGLNNMLVYGQPGGDNRKDTESWLWQLMGGAAGGYAVDLKMSMHKPAEAVDSYLAGNYAEGNRSLTDFLEKVVPVRQFADTISAYRMATEGRVNKRGEVITEPSLARAGLKFLGFTSTQEAVDRRKAGYMYTDIKERDAERQEFFDRWKDAKTDAERKQILADVKAYNQALPKNAAKAKITWKALNNARKRSEKALKVKGVYISERNRDLVQQ